jgi:hypothetical protein
MVSAASLCASPRVGYCAGNPDAMVGTMTPAITALLAAAYHHPTWKNLQWPNLNHRLGSLIFDTHRTA